MKGISFWFLFLASIFAVIGMAWGIQMSISADHTFSPAHAHNNLVGWVTLAIYGIYYARVPAAGKSKLALAHFWIALLGAVTIGPGIAMAISARGEALAQIASVATIVSALIFAINVWTYRAALSET